jgi:hypothetical protein
MGVVQSPIQLHYITEIKNTGCYGVVSHIMLVMLYPLMDLKLGMRTDNG